MLYNEPVLAEAHRDAVSERGVIAAADFVTDVLRQQGARVDQLPAKDDLASIEAELVRRQPDVVFNLFEGLADSPYTETRVANLLARLGIAFTGSTGRALALARNKPLAKRHMERAGLPTPRSRLINSWPIGDCTLRWPLIVKPAHEDASLGIDQESVVVDQRQLEARVRHVQARYGASVLVEEYIAGRELSVAVVESPRLAIKALPPIEMEFRAGANVAWPILTYDSKWQPGSVDYEASRALYGTNLEPSLREQVGRLARRAFRCLGCRDYARVDFRIAPDGQPYILEVNPNPDASPTACLAGALRSAGIAPDDFVAQLVRGAWRRARNGAIGDDGRIALDRLARA